MASGDKQLKCTREAGQLRTGVNQPERGPLLMPTEATWNEGPVCSINLLFGSQKYGLYLYVKPANF